MPNVTLHALNTLSSFWKHPTPTSQSSHCHSSSSFFPPKVLYNVYRLEEAPSSVILEGRCYPTHSPYLPGGSCGFLVSWGQDLSLAVCVLKGQEQSLTQSWAHWVLASGQELASVGEILDGGGVPSTSAVSECPVLQPDVWQENLGGLSHLWPADRFSVGWGCLYLRSPPIVPQQ